MRLATVLSLFLVTALHADINVTNFSAGETIRYPVPLLRGTCSDKGADSVTVTLKGRPVVTGVAKDGAFVALAHLAEGENQLKIVCGAETSSFVLNYKPQTNRHIVRSIYAVDSSGETDYQSPLENDPQDYEAKFGTAMLLLQSLTAEWMNDQGFGRRTFRLELDEDQKVIVHTHKDKQPKEHYFGMNDQKWWREIYGMLGREGYPTREAKNVVVAGYTFFDPEKKKVFAHTALGGGGLGLFGSGGMFTWPSSVDDAFRAFSDSTPVDPSKVHNDSAGRNNHWGMAATTIGAVCHEVGHTFGLPHTTNQRGIMARGFDRLNRMFAFEDAPSSRKQRVIGLWQNSLPYWAPESSSLLRYSKFFTLDDVDYSKDGKAMLEVRQDATEKDVIHISAKFGIRLVAISGAGDSVGSHDSFHKEDEVKTSLKYSLAEVLKRAGQEEFAIRIADSRGNYRKFASKDFLRK